MIGQAIGAYTDATHGMTLSAVSLPYYRHIMPYGLHKFARFAKEVWGVRTENMSDQEAAEGGETKEAAAPALDPPQSTGEIKGSEEKEADAQTALRSGRGAQSGAA